LASCLVGLSLFQIHLLGDSPSKDHMHDLVHTVHPRIKYKPLHMTILIDTREQRPLDFSPLGIATERTTLTTGDYSLKGLTHEVVVERKSLDDLLGVVGQHRERFDREIERMKAFRSKLIVVECAFDDLDQGNWRSKITPTQVQGSCLGWMAHGIPFIFCASRERLARHVANFLYINAKRRWRELQAFDPGFGRKKKKSSSLEDLPEEDVELMAALE
jgi:ERCC4-type nuclease